MPAATEGVLVIGAGGLAADVADMLRESPGMSPVGFVEGIDRSRCGEAKGGLPVHWIDDVGALAGRCRAVAAIGDPARRATIERLRALGFAFVAVVHPAARVAPSASCGEGAVVAPGCVLAAGAVIGRHVYVNRGALIGHDTTIGDFSTIGPGANLAGGCAVGAASVIGIGATLIERIALGEGCVVAAGATVTRDFGPGARLGGVPARRLPERRP